MKDPSEAAGFRIEILKPKTPLLLVVRWETGPGSGRAVTLELKSRIVLQANKMPCAKHSFRFDLGEREG